MVPAAYQRGNL